MKLTIRFSLRTLAIVLTLICLVIGVPTGYIRYRAERQRQAIVRLEELNVAVGLQADAKTTWVTYQLRRWIDKDAYRKIATVEFRADSADIDEAILLLTVLDDLRAINCDSLSLTDGHFVRIAKIPTLTHLAVEQGTCTTQTTKRLLENANWEMLSLPKVILNDELLGEVAKQKNLLRLAFDATDASSEGLESLAKCQRLQEVFLYRAKHAGGFARAVRQLPKMRQAILLKSSIGADDLAEFGDVGSLSMLHFYECSIDTSKSGALANAKGVSNLEFFKSPVAQNVIDAVCELPKLQILSLDSCLDDSNAGDLVSLPALRILSLSKTALTDEGLHHLANIRTLTLVVLPEDTKCTEAGIRHLQEKAAIRVVIGEHMSNGMVYLPGGLTEDRRKPKKP